MHLHLDHLGTISLDDLNAQAELLTRVDRKYLVPVQQAQSIVDQLTGAVRVLEIAGKRTFSYSSTYFDTPELDSYLMAAHGRRRGFKLRTRAYLDSDLCFLELKTTGLRGATVKERIVCGLGDAERLTEPGRSFVADCLVLAGVCSPAQAMELAWSLKPVMATTYRRATFHLPHDNARTTIDTDLAWYDMGGVTVSPDQRDWAALGQLAVVETKSAAKALSVDKLLWASGNRPTKMSKYATGLAVLHPELPSNKWHRVLNRDLLPMLIR